MIHWINLLIDAVWLILLAVNMSLWFSTRDILRDVKKRMSEERVLLKQIYAAKAVFEEVHRAFWLTMQEVDKKKSN